MSTKIPIPLSVYEGEVTDQPDDEVWIRGGDYPASVARKIIFGLKKYDSILVAAIGSKAVNQGIKGLAIARQMWKDGENGESDTDLIASPYFSTFIDEQGQDRTRIMILVFLAEDSYVSRRLHSETI